METYSLFELNEHIRRVIALNFEEHLWVRCEISQAKSSRGHYYLDLIEKSDTDDSVRAQASAVIWSRKMSFIKKKFGDVVHEVLRDGVEVRLRIQVDFHERYGLKLMVEDIDPTYTLGNLELQRREILTRLEKERLLERNRTVPLPVVAQKVAVLSSGQAAGYHDFINELAENVYDYSFETDLYPVALQGGRVTIEVVQALAQIGKISDQYDCVVIIRGGGSRIDLSGFDSFEIGHAIAHCPLPVFTGIGHEVDQSVADVVAHTSLKTPTAAAAFLIELNAHFDTTVSRTYQQIVADALNRARTARQELRDITSRLQTVPSRKVIEETFQLQQFLPHLKSATEKRLGLQRQFLKHVTEMVAAVEPSRVLKRGFSMTFLRGKLLTDKEQVSADDVIETHLANGSVNSKVIS